MSHVRIFALVAILTAFGLPARISEAGLALGIPDIYGNNVRGGFNSATGELSINGYAVSVEGPGSILQSLYMGKRNPLDPLAWLPPGMIDTSGWSARFSISGTVDSNQNLSGTFEVWGTTDSSQDAVTLLAGSLTESKVEYGAITGTASNGKAKRNIGMSIVANRTADNTPNVEFGPQLLIVIGGEGTTLPSVASGFGNFLDSFQFTDGTIDAANAVPEPNSLAICVIGALALGIRRRKRQAA